jgi:hypothetical protein
VFFATPPPPPPSSPASNGFNEPSFAHPGVVCLDIYKPVISNDLCLSSWKSI